MEKRIKDRFKEDILAIARMRFGIQEECIKPLGGFESFIYEYQHNGISHILRIAHTIRRSENLIRAEVDWINYLAAGGTSVARAILSESRNLVEVIEDGEEGFFLATAFLKIKGEPLHKTDWTPKIIQSYGRLLGKMHSLSKSYEPSDPKWTRPAWNDPIMLEVEKYLPITDKLVRDIYRGLLERFNTLECDKNSYGLMFDVRTLRT